jgi:hypothetical protein
LASGRGFVLAYFVRSPAEVQAVRAALGLPLQVARLTVPLPVIERRLASDVSSGRRDDLREAAASIAASAGVGIEDVVISNDHSLGVVAHDVMAFLGWHRIRARSRAEWLVNRAPNGCWTCSCSLPGWAT